MRKELRTFCDPSQVDATAEAQQRALIAKVGGVDAVRAGASAPTCRCPPRSRATLTTPASTGKIDISNDHNVATEAPVA
jgi:hypothetical protein